MGVLQHRQTKRWDGLAIRQSQKERAGGGTDWRHAPSRGRDKSKHVCPSLNTLLTKEAFQRVDIKKKYGVKRLREIVERNLEGDRASPMKSTPSWVHESVPTKHDGVAKLNRNVSSEKGHGWCDTNSKTVSLFLLTCQGRFVRKRNLQASQRKTASTQSGQLSESWLFGRGRSINMFFGEFPPSASPSFHGLIGKTKRQFSESGALPAAVTDQQGESSSSSDTRSSSSIESNA